MHPVYAYILLNLIDLAGSWHSDLQTFSRKVSTNAVFQSSTTLQIPAERAPDDIFGDVAKVLDSI